MPPVQPELTSQQSTLCLEMYSRSRLPYSAGGRGRKGAPKQVEKSGWTPTRPFSVPAALAVEPARKWYIACAGVSLAIGGITPEAVAGREIMLFGGAAAPAGEAPRMQSDCEDREA